DVVWVLYDRIMRINPDRPDDPARDRFLLSKGHGPMAYYAVLAAKGFISDGELESWATFDSVLGMHPDRTLVPGVEISSGSLGHGLPIAVGVALGLRARANPARVFCLVGDAELHEGSNHEAIAVAARFELASLIAVVIDNSPEAGRWPGGVAARFEVEGWTAATVDGRDHDDIERGILAGGGRLPHVVVARIEPEH
ncbi:MAG: thiamine pyrophosphate-dependent enzyme, partial [Acidimicrobiia bacterium]|nr:thiamine pyrophosphate-dependent enzyme [Acidimicrobiia bacterium]